MDDKLGVSIIMLIQTVVFLAPVLLLFYRQGRRDQMVDEAVRDINGLGAKISDTKTNEAQAFTELKAQVSTISDTLIRVTTSIDFIAQDIEEMKNRGK